MNHQKNEIRNNIRKTKPPLTTIKVLDHLCLICTVILLLTSTVSFKHCEKHYCNVLTIFCHRIKHWGYKRKPKTGSNRMILTAQ